MDSYKRILIFVGALIILCVVLASTMNSISKKSSSKSPMENMTAQEHANMSETDIKNVDSSASDVNVSETKIDIKDSQYTPKTVTVKVGDTVTWTNQDSVGHTVTDEDGSTNGPASGNLEKGDSYSFTFKRPGTFNYYCIPHPSMMGIVVVQ